MGKGCKCKLCTTLENKILFRGTVKPFYMGPFLFQSSPWELRAFTRASLYKGQAYRELTHSLQVKHQ